MRVHLTQTSSIHLDLHYHLDRHLHRCKWAATYAITIASGTLANNL